MWTHFNDMHSGGGCKEPPYEHIYVEADKAEAKVIFYNRFKHNPERVSCTCCGNDYSIDTDASLSQITGFHRGCRSLLKPVKGINYLEDGDSIPKGGKLYPGTRIFKYQPLTVYLKSKDVLVIYEKDIKAEERTGIVPEQGYVWKD